MMTALKHLMILKALLSAEAAGCAGPRTEGELRKTLWESRSFTCPDCHSGYSKDTRPSVAVAAEAYTGAENETLPFAAPAEDIQVAVQFFTLQDVDATLGTISVQATVNLYWVDKRLAFNDSSQACGLQEQLHPPCARLRHESQESSEAPKSEREVEWTTPNSPRSQDKSVKRLLEDITATINEAQKATAPSTHQKTHTRPMLLQNDV